MEEASESLESPESPLPDEMSVEAQAQDTEAPTPMEAIHERVDHEGRQAVTEDALREVLRLLDPHPQDAALTYAQVLGRLENVIARELQAHGSE